MSFTIITAEQRSPEWFQARAGRLTGSVADAVTATLKSGGEPAARRDLRIQLAVERLTSRPEMDGFINAAMQRGIDLEPVARGAYEAATGNMVRSTGFLQHDELMVGCSLDGDVDAFQGIVEIKCPKSATHLGYVKAGKLPTDYVAQVTHNLWVSNAAWCDFVSFDDRLPEDLQLLIVRVSKDELNVDAYAAAAQKFLEEVDAEVRAINAMRSPQ